MLKERTSSREAPKDEPNVTAVVLGVPLCAAVATRRWRRPAFRVFTGPTWLASHFASGLAGGLAPLRCGHACVTLPPCRSCFFFAADAAGTATARAATRTESQTEEAAHPYLIVGYARVPTKLARRRSPLGDDLDADEVVGGQLARRLDGQHRLQRGDRDGELARGRARASSAAGAACPAT